VEVDVVVALVEVVAETMAEVAAEVELWLQKVIQRREWPPTINNCSTLYMYSCMYSSA
jgi:hypothetical protein